VTAAATAIAAQNAATANSNIALITTQQANVISDPTLKVYLLAPEYSGSGAWLDKSGNGKNATVQVGTATKSAAGNSIVLNGSTAWQFNDVNVGNAWTASVWYKQTGTNGGNGYILTQGAYNGANRINLSMGRGNNSVGNNNFNVFGFYNSSNLQTVYPNSINLETNVWVNLQLTWNGTNMSLYRDGSLVQTVVAGGVSVTSGLNYHIGWRQDASSYVTGEIGEVRIFNRPLSTTEITNVYLENLPIIVGPPTVPENLTGSIITDSDFTVSWTGGVYATSYTYTLNGVATTPATDNGRTSKSAVFSGLSPLTEYTVIVTAVNPAASVTSSSVVIKTAGLQLWLDGKDQSSMTITGGNIVTVWNDKSSLNNNTTSAVGTPRLGVNGITFDTSSYFNLPDGCFPFNDVPYTIYIILKANSGNTGFLTTGNYTYTVFDSAGNKIGIQGPALNSSITSVNIGTTLSLYTITYSSPGYSYIQYINGTQSASSTGTGPRNQTSTSNILGKTGYTFNSGSIGEMLVYNYAHNTASRQKVEGTLAWKWGLRDKLPVNHPYFISSTGVITPQLWLDGADPLGTGTPPANGTSITSWKDKSGNGAHATSSGTCVYQASTASIALTSGSYSNSTISSGTFNNAISIFAVYRGKGSGSFNPLICRSRAGFNLGNPDTYNDQRIFMTGIGFFNNLTSTYNLDNSSISSRVIFGYSMNQSTNNISEWTNGTANTITGSYTLPANMDSGNNFNTIFIGNRGDGVTGPFTGNFSEILIYNTPLTTTQRQDIEGYLAQKWGLRTWLPSSHPYYYDSGPVPVTSGLRLWLDGSDPLATGTAPANGTSITSWKDKSGNSAHATSSGTCVYQSLYKSIVLTSGRYSNTTISPGTFDNAIFIFAVYRGKASRAGDNTPLIIRSRDGYNIGNPEMFNTSRYYMTGLTTWAGVSSSYHLDNSTSTHNIFEYSMNQSANNISEWTNGTANTITGTYTLPANMDSINSFNGIYIGTRGDNFHGPFTGTFSEILIYNTALTATQRQQIEGYLAWKWSLQTQLPSNHPYKLSPPS
jgi:hypothetical protein